jgi:hypothetical protein
MAPDEPDSFANLVAWPSIASTSQVLIRAEALARAGPFDPAVVPSDDWDMWIRLSLLGPLRRVVRFTVAKREHREGYHHNRAAMRGAEPRLRRKLAASPLLDEAQKRLAHLGQRHGARRRLRWAREHLAKGDWASATSSLAQALRSYVNYLRAR